MKDNYDEQIEFLTQHPGNIRHNWFIANDLFAVLRPAHVSNLSEIHEGIKYQPGCLTMIRFNNCREKTKDNTKWGAFSSDGKLDLELTRKIEQDTRLPVRVEDIRPEHLPVFAEYQRNYKRD